MSSSDAPTRNPKRRTAAIAIAVLVATFAAGVLAGIAGDRLLLRRLMRDRMQSRVTHSMAARLDRALDLTPAQRRSVEAILEKHHSRINDAWNSIRPTVRAEMEAANTEIDRVLTPAQREKFARMKLRMGPHHRRGPRPRSGADQGAGGF